MKRYRVDFTKRDEKDRLPLPSRLNPDEEFSVIVFDDDIEATALVLKEQKTNKPYLEVNWATTKYSSWKVPPPKETQKYITENPLPTRQGTGI